MAHHSSGPEDEAIRKLFAEKLGPTGRFPEGKLTERDEGEIQIAIGSKDGKVVIDFGAQVVWIGFTPQQSREIAALLIQKADELEN